MIDWSAFFLVWLCVMIEYGLPLMVVITLLALLIAGGYLIYDKKFRKETVTGEEVSNED